jgi:hypothetical protein
MSASNVRRLLSSGRMLPNTLTVSERAAAFETVSFGVFAWRFAVVYTIRANVTSPTSGTVMRTVFAAVERAAVSKLARAPPGATSTAIAATTSARRSLDVGAPPSRVWNRSRGPRAKPVYGPRL